MKFDDSTQIGRVATVVFDCQRHTLGEIAKRARAPEAAASARLRDLRNLYGYSIETTRTPDGQYVYQLMSRPQACKVCGEPWDAHTPEEYRSGCKRVAQPGFVLMRLEHAWSRVRRWPGKRWRCRRCGRLFRIRTWRTCAQQLLLPGIA